MRAIFNKPQIFRKYMIKKSIFALIFILVFISFVQGMSNSPPNLNPRVEICVNDVSHCDNNNKQILNTDSIILKITITNKESVLTCLGDSVITFDFYKDPYVPNQYLNTKSKTMTLSKELCLPQNTEQTVYIPLQDYASVDPIDRSNKWVIDNVKLSYSQIGCYSNWDSSKISDYNKNLCQSNYNQNKVFIGDRRIEITASGSSPSLSWYNNLGSTVRGFLIGLNAILLIISTGLIILGFTAKKSKKASFFIGGFILLIVTLALFGFGFYS